MIETKDNIQLFKGGIKELIDEGINFDEYAQGYLLITIGRNKDYE